LSIETNTGPIEVIGDPDGLEGMELKEMHR